MPKILLVEPDVLLSKSYKKALEGQGYEVFVFRTAQDAIHGTDEHRPDLIILEIQLMGHSGIEFLYELRSYSDWQTLPVVVISNVSPGEFSEEQQLLWKELNVNTYIYKPQLKLKDLIQLVARHTSATKLKPSSPQ